MTQSLTELLATAPITRNRDRSVTMQWSLGEGTDHYGEPGELRLSLSVSHDKDRKRFIVHVIRVCRQGNVESHSLMDFISLPSVPCARFSQTQLNGAALDSMNALRTMGDDPKLVELVETGKVTR